MARSDFVYEGRSVEEINQRARQSGGLYDSYVVSDIQMYKPKDGENAVRILPPTWGPKHPHGSEELKERWKTGWEIQIHLHWDVGADRGAYLCLDKVFGKPCPICEARKETDDPDEADAFKPQWRALCWVIDRDNEKAGPMVWSMPLKLFKEINNRSQDKKSGKPIMIDHPEEGYDVIFTREGKSKRTDYTGVEVDRDPTPLSENEKTQKRWLEYIEELPLPDVLNAYEYDHIAKVLTGQASARRRRDEEEEDAPRSRRKRATEDEEDDQPRSRRASKPWKDDDEEEDKSSRRSRRTTEPEEEEEEDKRPRRRATSDEEEDKEERTTKRHRIQAQQDDPEEPEDDEKGKDEDDDNGAASVAQRLRDRLKKNRRASAE